jgi:hypothetical protein
VACCQDRNLKPPAYEERVRADEEGIGALAHSCCESLIDLAAGARVQHQGFKAQSPGGLR